MVGNLTPNATKPFEIDAEAIHGKRDDSSSRIRVSSVNSSKKTKSPAQRSAKRKSSGQYSARNSMSFDNNTKLR